MCTTKLSVSQIAALRAVDAGRVTNRFDNDGNVFEGPAGIGAISYRRLQQMKLIEDIPGQRLGRYYKQRLTAAGREILKTAEHSK
jgi:hypothetical protein